MVFTGDTFAPVWPVMYIKICTIGRMVFACLNKITGFDTSQVLPEEHMLGMLKLTVFGANRPNRKK